jgi:hypothetical protein
MFLANKYTEIFSKSRSSCTLNDQIIQPDLVPSPASLQSMNPATKTPVISGITILSVTQIYFSAEPLAFLKFRGGKLHELSSKDFFLLTFLALFLPQTLKRRKLSAFVQ